jgi:hypothetical protein
MLQHGLAGLFGGSEGFERRADDLHGGPILMNGTPGRYEAEIAPKAGTTPALKTDHERKAVATRIPYLDVLNGSDNAAELHGTPHMRLPPKKDGHIFAESKNAVLLT